MMTQIITFNVKPEHYDSLRTALIEDKRNAEQEEGSLKYDFSPTPKNPTSFSAMNPGKTRMPLIITGNIPTRLKVVGYWIQP